MLSFRKIPVAKMFMDKKGGISKFSVEIFCLTVPKIYVVEPFSVSLVSDNEKFCSSVGYVTVFRRKTFVLQFRNLPWRNPSMLCFRKIPESKKFKDKKGDYHVFSSKNLYLTVPKKTVVEPFTVSLFLVFLDIEKFHASEVYVTIFRRTLLVSQYQNISWRNLSMLCLRKFLVPKKFMDKREGEVSRFSAENFCLTVPKIYVVEPFSVSLVSDNEKFCSSVGYVMVFRRKTFVLQFRNLPWRNLFMLFQKISGSGKVMDKKERVS